MHENMLMTLELILAIVVANFFDTADAQYFKIVKEVPTPHLKARIPKLPPRMYGTEVVGLIHSHLEVATKDFEKTQKEIVRRTAFALGQAPLQYFEVQSFKWLTAGQRCVPGLIRCRSSSDSSQKLLGPGIGGAMPGLYDGNLADADPRLCYPADGRPPLTPTQVQEEAEPPPTKFDPEWDPKKKTGKNSLDSILPLYDLCVHKANTSLQHFPISIENVFITGWRDVENSVVDHNVEQKLKLELHVVGVIPVTWAQFLNRKFVFNGTIPMPMYQPEIVDPTRSHTDKLNVTLPILAIRKEIRHADDGGDIITFNMPVCEDPKVSGEGCVQIEIGMYDYPPLGEYKLRSYAEWRKVNFTRIASDQPYPLGDFNVSQGPWPLVEWIAKDKVTKPGPWTTKQFPQKESKYDPDCITGKECDFVAHAPPLRHLHSAVLYKTWSFKNQAWRYLCKENDQCGHDCLGNLTCLGGKSFFDDDFFFRSSYFRNDDGGITPLYTHADKSCPAECCQDRRLCMRFYDVTGFDVPFDTEMMLVFGGKSYVHQKDPKTGRLIYHACERIPKQELRSEWQSCMEIVLGDLWRYNIGAGRWDYIKTDSAISATTLEPVGFPLPRFGHSAVVVEQREGQDAHFKRYFMYIYGGMSPRCPIGGVCSDVWKYEIPWSAQAYYPKYPDGKWNRGNEWMKLKDCPFGGRYRHAMVVTSAMEYIYSYGGQVIGGFTHTLMRYRISTDMWEDLDPFGRISLTRLMYDFQGQRVVTELPLEEHNRDVDVDCKNAWRYDGKWAHCAVCAECGLKTGTRDKGSKLPEERGDTVLVNFADLSSGAVDDLIALFGGFRTTWGTLTTPDADSCATGGRLPPDADIPSDRPEGKITLTESPKKQNVETTTTNPQKSGIEVIGTFQTGKKATTQTTTTTWALRTSKTTTLPMKIETYTSTSTATKTTRTTTTTTTITSTRTLEMAKTTTTMYYGPQTFPPVVAGTVTGLKNISGQGYALSSESDATQARLGPQVCSDIKYYFDDLWLYEATTNQFFELPTVATGPNPRKGHKIIARRSRTNDTQLVLFGGNNQDKAVNDLWVLNIMRGKTDRKWARIDEFFDGIKPPTMSYHTMLHSDKSGAMIVFGGIHWKETDLERSDALRNVDRRCLKKVQSLIDENKGKLEPEFLRMMRISCNTSDFCCTMSEKNPPPVFIGDMRIRTIDGALNLTAISILCRADCESKAFYTEYQTQMVEGIWEFQMDFCPGNCSNHGICDFSQCVCEPGYYGIDCSQKRCPGTTCYTDHLTKEQFCVECSSRGRCIYGQCSCMPGWGFDDCSAVLCDKNCSSTPNETRGECVDDFPVHQCVCTGAWSGVDCNELLCLNGCSSRGNCLPNGTCACADGYYGEDCSLWTITIK